MPLGFSFVLLFVCVSMSSGEILRLIMESGEICNTIYLTAQDWWECYVQRAWLNKQVPHSKSAGTRQEPQPLFKSSFCLPCIYTPSLFPFKNLDTAQIDLWMSDLAGCLWFSAGGFTSAPSLPGLKCTISVHFDTSWAQLPRGLANLMPRQGFLYLT